MPSLHIIFYFILSVHSFSQFPAVINQIFCSVTHILWVGKVIFILRCWNKFPRCWTTIFSFEQKL